MKSNEKVFLKDGTLWDDDKSDEFVDELLERMGQAAKEGKLVIGSKVMYERMENIKKAGEGHIFSVSIKYLPKELQRELLQTP